MSKRMMTAEQKKNLSDKAKARAAAKQEQEAQVAAKLERLAELEAAEVTRMLEDGRDVTDSTSKVPPKVGPKVPSKKGRTSWKPAQLLTVRDKTPGFRYRWVTNDPDNLRRKEEEGWEYVKKTTGLGGRHDLLTNTIDGKPLCSDDVSYRDSTLMALPEEIAKARDDYQANRVKEQSHEIGRKLKDATNKLGKTSGEAPKLHGAITFD